MATSRANLLPSVAPPPSTRPRHTSQPVASSSGFSHAWPENHTLTEAHIEWPDSAPKKVTAFPSSTSVYNFLAMGDVKKAAGADILWHSLLAETESPSKDPVPSGFQQQTNEGFSGHIINFTSWQSHSVLTGSPSGSLTATNAIAITSQSFQNTVGHVVTTEGLSILDLLSSSSFHHLKSGVTVVGSRKDVWRTSSNSHSRTLKQLQLSITQS